MLISPLPRVARDASNTRRIAWLCAALLCLTSCGEDSASQQPGPADTCATIRCDMPPAPSCVGQVALAHSSAGVCQEGECSYQQTLTDCASTDQVCSNGVCLDAGDPCASVSCDMPPAASCVGQVAVTHATTGTCQEGECSYQQTLTDCAATNTTCQDGACVDMNTPCEDASCDMPPAPSCVGQVAVTHDEAGTCQNGACAYAQTLTDCAATNTRCQDGACVEPCAGVSCDMPPAPSCMGDIALTHDEAGTCQAGMCTYQETQTNCAALNQRCDAGVCVIDVAQVAAGYAHTCARRQSGQVLCWGKNDFAALGDGTTTHRNLPTTVLNLIDAVELTTGRNHTCARRQNNSIVCWGFNFYGQIGDGTTAYNRTSPTPVLGLSDAVELAAGRDHTCARRQDGRVACWGRNEDGQIGNNSTSDTSFGPSTVSGLSDAVEIAAGEFHTCARRQDNTVVCWGENASGQLGDGSNTQRLTPVAVVGLSDAVAIAAGGRHTCARRQDNSVVCWGANYEGQLGDGTATTRRTPTAVMGLSDAVAIDAGLSHTCARRQNNSVVCWGSNDEGQLGDDGTTDRSVPTPVMGLSDAVELSAGDAHTCARRQNNTLVCWGWNQFGQLGDDSTTQRLVPTDVGGL